MPLMLFGQKKTSFSRQRRKLYSIMKLRNKQRWLREKYGHTLELYKICQIKGFWIYMFLNGYQRAPEILDL